jgi:hypothetical protein
MTNTTNAPTDKQIAAFARTEARRAISVRRLDPELAAQIVADAQAQCDAMYAAQRAARHLRAKMA